MTKALKQFRSYIEQEAYFQAHEVLEAYWFPRRFEADNEVKLIKGFINAAVSFELYKRRRYKRSQQVWATYLKYRQLLFKTQSKYYNEYYALSRFIEAVHSNLKGKK
jgi:Ser/Thr protein kinase RdoA (MazF antagonist)